MNKNITTPPYLLLLYTIARQNIDACIVAKLALYLVFIEVGIALGTPYGYLHISPPKEFSVSYLPRHLERIELE
ncbi:MAG: hypothetical protein ACYSW3_00025 [Planctomycetota bacterium]